MGLENVKAFKKALMENEELVKAMQEREKAYTGDKNDRDAAYRDVLVPFAKENGFDFTVEEIKACEKKPSEGAIGDEDVAAVSGGLDYPAECVMTGDDFGDCGCVILGFGTESGHPVCLIIG